MATFGPLQRPEPKSPNPFASSPPSLNTYHGDLVMEDADGRSSSLSEIDEGGAVVRSPSAQADHHSEAGDTEAETERLDDSPQKSRNNQNIILTTTNGNQYSETNTRSQTVITKEEPLPGRPLSEMDLLEMLISRYS